MDTPEIRWVYEEDGEIKIGGNPTPTDLLEQAEEKLKDEREFNCSARDHRLQ